MRDFTLEQINTFLPPTMRVAKKSMCGAERNDVSWGIRSVCYLLVVVGFDVRRNVIKVKARVHSWGGYS